MPGVSESTNWWSSPLRMPKILWRVVCAFGLTMESCSPSKAFSRVLLPTFGLPMMLTNPALCSMLR